VNARVAWVLLALVAPAKGEPAALQPPPAGLTARAVAERVEERFRGNTSYLRAEMIVTSPRLPAPRRVRFESWDDRPGRRNFIRILAPPKDAGVTFLKLHPNLWNYIPRVERTVRIPPSLMMQSWMGSDFTNDDLVKEGSQLDDYEHRWLGVDPAPGGDAPGPAYVVEYLPKEEAAVVWGRIVAWIEAARFVPLRQEFYDEAGERLRALVFEGVREFGGRPYPTRWTMTPLDKPGHETAVVVEEIRFDERFDDEIFTERNLRRRP
jgi:outer membrane lipoprotein-sorting protein